MVLSQAAAEETKQKRAEILGADAQMLSLSTEVRFGLLSRYRAARFCGSGGTAPEKPCRAEVQSLGNSKAANCKVAKSGGVD